jgi:hypothetical protein
MLTTYVDYTPYLHAYSKYPTSSTFTYLWIYVSHAPYLYACSKCPTSSTSTHSIRVTTTTVSNLDNMTSLIMQRYFVLLDFLVQNYSQIQLQHTII